MEVKPGYKQTEVGIVPHEWDVVEVQNVTLSHKQGFYTNAGYVSQGCKLVRVTDLENNVINYEAMPMLRLTDRDYESFKVQRGDFLFVRSGASIGRYGIVYGDTPAVFGSYIIRFVFKPDTLVNEFFGFVYQTPTVFKQLLSIIQGSSNININAGNIKALKIPLPKISEQRTIAEALSDVDALHGGVDRLIAKKRDLKRAVMQQLLTGQTRLSGFHGKWEVKTFGELFNFSGGYSASRDQLSSEGYCYLHYGDIHGTKKTTVDVRADYQNIPKLDIPLKRIASKSLLEDGDVVFVDASEDDGGTSRHVVVVNKDRRPFISGLHTIVAKSKTDDLAHEYRRYCFQTAAIRQQFLFYAVGTKVSGISKTNIAKLKMPVPKIPEQTAIASLLMEMDAELAALEQRREKTRALKQGMMQELLTGGTRFV